MQAWLNFSIHLRLLRTFLWVEGWKRYPHDPAVWYPLLRGYSLVKCVGTSNAGLTPSIILVVSKASSGVRWPTNTSVPSRRVSSVLARCSCSLTFTSSCIAKSPSAWIDNPRSKACCGLGNRMSCNIVRLVVSKWHSLRHWSRSTWMSWMSW